MSSPGATSPLTLVVLAGGRGTRFGGSKQAAAVGPAGEFLLDYALFDARRAGFTRAVLVVRPGAEADFQARCARLPQDFGCDVVAQRTDLLPAEVERGPRDAPWGTGHAVLAARHLIGSSPFAVVNADDFYGREAYALAVAAADRAEVGSGTLVAMRLGQTLSPHGPVTRALCRTSGDLLTGLDEVRGLERRGAAVVSADGTEVDPETLASMNCWVFPPRVLAGMSARLAAFARDPGMQAREFLLPVAVADLVASGELAVNVVVSPGPWFGLTHAADRPGVADTLRRLTAEGVYPSPLW